jgi:hypothetical protein
MTSRMTEKSSTLRSTEKEPLLGTVDDKGVIRLSKKAHDDMVQALIKDPNKMEELNTMFNNNDIKHYGGLGYSDSVFMESMESFVEDNNNSMNMSLYSNQEGANDNTPEEIFVENMDED